MRILGCLLPLAIATVALSLTSASAQQPVAVVVPGQFASARTVFLGCGGAPGLQDLEREVLPVLYADAQSALGTGAHLQFHNSPADVELLLKISIVTENTGVMLGSFNTYNLIRIAVFDPKTHALLWNIDEPLAATNSKASMEKNIPATMQKIVADYNTLAAGKLPGA